MAYDSRPDTYAHIHEVQRLMLQAVADLQRRAWAHDQSKLQSPERDLFDEYTPLLRDTTYGSEEYKAHLKRMGAALEHHYAANRHHPEHHENGVEDMTLVDVLEMICDWKAASQRHADGSLERSIEQNAGRFGYGPELRRLLLNTTREFGWL